MVLMLNFFGQVLLGKKICVIENTDTVIDPDNNEAGCIICTDTNKLFCDDIRLSSLVKTPCVDIGIGSQQGLTIKWFLCCRISL